MCEFAAYPAIKYYAGSDQSTPALGLTCTRLHGNPPNSSNRGIAELLKLIQKLETWPW